MTNNKKGFTLIELLVVIAIIGILSAIGLVSLNGAREKARDSKARSDLATVRTGLALYYDDNNNTYPGEAVNATPDRSEDSAGGNAVGNFWLPAGPMVTEYMGAIKSPTTGATRTYGYITNSSANAGASTNWVVFYQLEGAGGLNYYAVDNLNNVTDTAQANTTAPVCVDTLACTL